MALPTAPLGQLSGMNMPYAIPTYEQPPSLWEKALTSFLVQAAGGVAQRGAENLMTRDAAPEFGEKPATGFSRLLGPKVGPEEARQRRQNIFTAGEGEKSRAFSKDEDALRFLNEQGRDDARMANERLLQGDRTQAGLDEQYLRDQNAGLRQDRDVKASLDLEGARAGHEGAQIDQRAKLEQENIRLRALLESQDPGRQAQAQRDLAAAEEARGRVDFTKKFLGGSTTPSSATPQTARPAANVDPSVAAFAKEKGRVTPGGNSDAAMKEFMSYMPQSSGGGAPTPVQPAPIDRAGNLVAPPAELPDPNSVLSILRDLFATRDAQGNIIHPSISPQ